jgi:hypothetical protein
MMLRRIALVLALAVSAPLVACKGTENVTGNPIGGGEGRTLSSMAPLITKSLTVTSAETAFGFPNARTTTPPIILVYDVDDGRKVSLGFPDMVSPISFAQLTDKNGGVSNLTINDK